MPKYFAILAFKISIEWLTQLKEFAAVGGSLGCLASWRTALLGRTKNAICASPEF
jgi:hypothetical protein